MLNQNLEQCHLNHSVGMYSEKLLNKSDHKKIFDHLKTCTTCKKTLTFIDFQNRKIKKLIPSHSLKKDEKEFLENEINEAINLLYQELPSESFRGRIMLRIAFIRLFFSDFLGVCFSKAMIKYYFIAVILSFSLKRLIH